MKSNRPAKSRQRFGIVGLAFDSDDGQKRITRGTNFVLAGGSEETHGRMRETVVKVSERLEQHGKQLENVSTGELRDIFREVTS